MKNQKLFYTIVIHNDINRLIHRFCADFIINLTVIFMKKLLFVFVLTLSYLIGNGQEEDRGYIVKTGDKAPDIDIIYTDGTRKKLSDFRGKTVMIQFTASWCGVCRKEMPFIEKDIQQKYKDHPDFALIGIDLKESREKTMQFAKDMKITYPLTLDPEGTSFYSFAAQNAGVTRNIIIDKKGNIVYLTRLYNPEEFGDMLKVIEKLVRK